MDIDPISQCSHKNFIYCGEASNQVIVFLGPLYLCLLKEGRMIQDVAKVGIFCGSIIVLFIITFLFNF